MTRFDLISNKRHPHRCAGWLASHPGGDGIDTVVICLTATLVFDAPTVLKACMGALLLWIPLQAFVNARITKVSAHVAVMTACTLGVVWIEAWRDPAVWIIGAGIVALVAWARITTRNHSLLQVTLGVLTGAIPVLVVFSAVL